MKLHERITRWREFNGLTKAEFARRVGKSSACIAQWESGETEPTHESVDTIAEVFGISLSMFWGDPPAKPRKAS